MAMLTIDKAPGAYLNPKTSLIFAIVSFFLVVAVSAYHISTLIRRRKRRTDRLKLSRAKWIRSKHRAARKRMRELAAAVRHD